MHKNSYNPKSLNGNWYENRYTEDYNAQHDQSSNTYIANPCKFRSFDLINVLSIAHNKYVPVSRAIGNKPEYKKEKFGGATENWMNFQPGFSAAETFKTTNGTSYNEIGAREDPFKLKQTSLTGNQAALEEYRAQYTNGNHNFKRTYLGSNNWKKSDQ